MKTAIKEAWAMFDCGILLPEGHHAADFCVAHRGEQIPAEYVARFRNPEEFFL